MKIVNTKIDGLNKSICLFGDIHFNKKYKTKRFDNLKWTIYDTDIYS